MVARVRDIAGYAGAELIGQGGFGAVYRADDEAHGRQVAIKVLPSSLGESELRRFDRERQTMGRLGSHANIVPVYESGYTEAGEPYIVMELASGGSLRERLAASGPVPWEEAVEILVAVSGAVQAAHDKGVLHRDIKPDNILIDAYGWPKLADFGIASVAASSTNTTTTRASLAHAAPEQLQGEPSTTAVDVYALGSTFHTLVTGSAPFVRETDDSPTPIITRTLMEPPPDLRPQGIPGAVAAVVERAMAKDPDDRQETARQFGAELKSAAKIGSLAAWPPPSMVDTAVAASPAATTPSVADAAAATATFPADGTRTDDPAPSAADAAAATATLPADGQATGASTAPVAADSGAGVVQPTGTVTETWAGPPPDRRGGRVALAAGSVLAAVVGIGLVVWAMGGDDGTDTSGTTTTVTEPSTSTTGGPSTETIDPGSSTSSSASTTTTEPTTTSSNEPSTTVPSTTSTTTTTVVAGRPTVDIDCPDEIEIGAEIRCPIVTTNATAGRWNLPGFLSEPAPIDDVPGSFGIFIKPENPDAIGDTFTITASADDRNGRTSTASHDFVVTGPTVDIDCPDEMPLDVEVTCDIITTRAVEGEFDIPGFGSDVLGVVPGRSPISITAESADEVGRTFTITATVRNQAGIEVEATSDFVVVDS